MVEKNQMSDALGRSLGKVVALKGGGDFLDSKLTNPPHPPILSFEAQN